MKKYYKDFYGATASINEKKDGTAELTIVVGSKRTKKHYANIRGAKIAMGRYGECWVERG